MKKLAGIAGIVLAVVFLYMGWTVKIPGTYISSWGSEAMHEYVGGDAYNFIIEASLRGGEIAGARTEKAVYFAVAAILGVISLACLASDPVFPKPEELSPELKKLLEQEKAVEERLKKIEGKMDSLIPEKEEPREPEPEHGTPEDGAAG